MFAFAELHIPPELTGFSMLALGFSLGLRHAFEADHIAAVTTIVSDRKNLFSAGLVGGIWGIGHTISLLAVGIIVILLKMQISERTETMLEISVGVMLVLLGLNLFRKLFFTHTEHQVPTNDDSQPDKLEKKEKKSFFRMRSLIVGMVHGLAGSGALTLLIASSIPEPTMGLFFLLLFGLGSIGGMMLASLIFSLPFHFTALKFAGLNKLLQVFAGIIGIGFGTWLICEPFFAV